MIGDTHIDTSIYDNFDTDAETFQVQNFETDTIRIQYLELKVLYFRNRYGIIKDLWEKLMSNTANPDP